MKLFVWKTFALGIFLLITGCTLIYPDPTEYVYLPNGSGVIGTKGGEVYIGDTTSPIRDAICAIKAGALSGPKTFIISQAPANITVEGHPEAIIINVQPASTVFGIDAHIGMSYRHLDENFLNWIQLYRFNSSTGELIPLSDPDYDEERKILYGATQTLGYFVILQDETYAVITGTFTDTRDHQVYKSVTINNQVWMAENLNFATNTGSWCYDGNDANCLTYGRLYDLTTASSMCPEGWHLPSHDEWKTLESTLGMSMIDPNIEDWNNDGFVGKKIKSIAGWGPDGNGLDAVQFNALPGGFRDVDGSYSYAGESGRFWTSTSVQDDYFSRFLDASRDGIYWAVRGSGRGYSVRCIQGDDPMIPVVTTLTPSSITGFSANAGGEVVASGASSVTERGTCWNTTGYPQVGDNHTNDGSGTGSFNSKITGLTLQTNYYVRAYALNSHGIGYGDQKTFTTLNEVFQTDVMTDPRDNKDYDIVQIGTTWWMAENLDYKTNVGSWCYNELISNCNEYGRLYDWIGAMSACPPNWMLPGDEDWKDLEKTLGMSQDQANADDWRIDGEVGRRVKSASGWYLNGNGVNDSKLNIKPGGFRDVDGTYLYLQECARLWTSTMENIDTPWVRYLKFDHDGIYRTQRGIGRAFSVRCIEGVNTSLPEITTNNVSNVTDNSAQCGGNVISSGGSQVSIRGVCWNTTGYPIVNEGITVDGSGSGSFNSLIEDLLSKTKYYVRAYATNQSGTAYGQQIEFTTDEPEIIETDQFIDPRDNQVYDKAKIGDVWWMAENLNYQIADHSWCYDDLQNNCNIYGLLYDSDGANQACPNGWHLPTDLEWRTLEIALGMSQVQSTDTDWRSEGNVGVRMKSTNLWSFPAGNGDNSSKMNILPGGFRDLDGTSLYLHEWARLWTSTKVSNTDSWIRFFADDKKGVYRDFRGHERAYSVRCVED